DGHVVGRLAGTFAVDVLAVAYVAVVGLDDEADHLDERAFSDRDAVRRVRVLQLGPIGGRRDRLRRAERGAARGGGPLQGLQRAPPHTHPPPPRAATS